MDVDLVSRWLGARDSPYRECRRCGTTIDAVDTDDAACPTCGAGTEEIAVYQF